MNKPQAVPMNQKWRLVRNDNSSDTDLAAYVQSKHSLYDLPPVVEYLTQFGTWEPWGNFIQFLAREFDTEKLALSYVDEPFGDLLEEYDEESAALMRLLAGIEGTCDGDLSNP